MVFEYNRFEKLRSGVYLKLWISFGNIRKFLRFWLHGTYEKKKARTIKESFEPVLTSSKRKPNLLETDRGKDFYKSIFQNFLNKDNIKRSFRNAYLGAVFAERFSHTIRYSSSKTSF